MNHSDYINDKIEELRPWYQKIMISEKFETPGKWIPEVQFNVFKKHLSKDMSGKRVLDIGANAGGLSVLFAETGANVVAVEPNPKYFSQAEFVIKEKNIENIKLVKDGLENVLQLGEFDYVLFLCLLYHFRDPLFILAFLTKYENRVFVSFEPNNSGN